MQINSTDDLLAMIEQARTEQGLSARQLCAKMGKSPGLYWWLKQRGATTTFASALAFCEALGLEIEIRRKA